MSFYLSTKNLNNEIKDYLKRTNPRSDIGENYFQIRRSNTINKDLLLKYFDCAIAKEKNIYKAYLCLPSELEDKIPSWYTQDRNEIWIDSRSGLRGKNIYREPIFIIKFQLHIDTQEIKNISRNKNIGIQRALADEFIEIQDALIKGNDEPIDIIKNIYTNKDINKPKTNVAKYLQQVLKKSRS